MTTSGPGRDTTPGDDTEFAAELRQLFVAAGSPTLKAAANGSNRLSNQSSQKITAQRISDWRKGKHLPKDFETLHPLLVWLKSRTPTSPPEGVAHHLDRLPLPAWKALLEEAHGQQRPAFSVDDGDGALVPYAGLRPLGPADSQIFFGRERQIQQLKQLFTMFDESTEKEPHKRIVIVTGPSGAGKSSLLGAGLEKLGNNVQVIRLRSVESLELTPNAISSASEDMDTPVAIVVDQFEEVLRLDSREREQALSHLLSLLKSFPRSCVLLAVRSDFYQVAIEHDELADAWQHRCILLDRITSTELRNIIATPATLLGAKLERGLVDVLISELYTRDDAASSPNVLASRLPLLAQVLEILWKSRSSDTITTQNYRGTGGLANAINHVAERAWEAIPESMQPLAKSFCLSLVRFSSTADSSTARVYRGVVEKRTVDAHSQLSEIVHILTSHRILTGRPSAHGVFYEYAHEIVLTSWSRLERWTVDHANIIQSLQQLQDDVRRWKNSESSTSLLYSADQLRRLPSGGVGAIEDLPMPAYTQEFLRASRAHIRKTQIIKGLALVTVCALAAISTGIAIALFQKSEQLTTSRNSAQYGSIMATIDRELASDPSLASRLSIAAMSTRGATSSDGGIALGQSSLPLSSRFRGHQGAVYTVGYSPDGQNIVSGGKDGRVKVWQPKPQQRNPSGPPATMIAESQEFESYITSAIFISKDTIAAATGTGQLHLLKVEGSVISVTDSLSIGTGTLYSMAFNQDTMQLAVPSDDGSVSLVSVGAQGAMQVVASIRAHTSAVRTAVFNQDGTKLATGGDDQDVKLWSTGSTPQLLSTITGLGNIAHAIAFSPDDKSMAITGDGGTTRIAVITPDPRSPQLLAPLPASTGASWSLSYADLAGRPTLLRASQTGEVQVWDATNPILPSPLHPLRQITEADPGVFVVAAGKHGDIVTGSASGDLRLWSSPQIVGTHDGGIYDAQVTPDGTGGSILATTGIQDHRLRVWRLNPSPGPLRESGSAELQRRVNDRTRVAISPSGSLAATANNNGRLIEIWRISPAVEKIGEIQTHTRYTNQVKFSSDGRWLYASSADHSLSKWHVSDLDNPNQYPDLRSTEVGSWDGGLALSVTDSENGKTVAIGTDDQRLHILREGSQSSIPSPGGSIVSTAFLDDSHFVTGSSSSIQLWELDREGHPSIKSSIETPSVRRISVLRSPARAAQLVVSTEDGGISIYQASQKRIELTLARVDGGTSRRLIGLGTHSAGSSQLTLADRDTGEISTIGTDINQASQAICDRTHGVLDAGIWSGLMPSVPVVNAC